MPTAIQMLRRTFISIIVALATTACAQASAPAARHEIRAVPLATALAPSGGGAASAATAPQAVLPEIASAPTLAPDHLTAPGIGLDAPVVATDWTPGGEWRVPNGAAGWLANSAYVGAPGNTVLAGHHNTQGEVFRRAAELRPGDSIVVGAQGQTFEYRVAEVLILPAWGITPEQEQQYATWIARTRDTRLTLVTCWPYFTNSYRVIVIAKPPG